MPEEFSSFSPHEKRVPAALHMHGAAPAVDTNPAQAPPAPALGKGCEFNLVFLSLSAPIIAKALLFLELRQERGRLSKPSPRILKHFCGKLLMRLRIPESDLWVPSAPGSH